MSSLTCSIIFLDFVTQEMRIKVGLSWNLVSYDFPWIKKYGSRECYIYSYSLKLALLLRPQDRELHEWILSRMDLDRFKPLHFEILCFLAKYVGCKNRQFELLYDQRVWLYGLDQPLLSDLKNLTEPRNDEGKYYYCRKRCKYFSLTFSV